jgi:hypothetical protein
MESVRENLCDNPGRACPKGTPHRDTSQDKEVLLAMK